MRHLLFSAGMLRCALVAAALAAVAIGCSSEPEPWEEGELVDGRRHGTWTSYRADGTKAAQGRYDRDRKEGAWQTWYADGAPESERTYQDGTLEGPCTEWHPNGQKRLQGEYHAGRRDGTWYQWDEEGNLVREQEYESGTLMESYLGGKPDTQFVIRIELKTLQEAGLDPELVLSDLKKLTLHPDYTYSEEEDGVVIVTRDRRAGDMLMEHGFTNPEGTHFRLRDLSTMKRLSEDTEVENPVSS